MSADKIEYEGTVWLIDNNNPEPLLNHSMEKLIKYGDDITITDAPDAKWETLKIWPHH